MPMALPISIAVAMATVVVAIPPMAVTNALTTIMPTPITVAPVFERNSVAVAPVMVV